MVRIFLFFFFAALLLLISPSAVAADVEGDAIAGLSLLDRLSVRDETYLPGDVHGELEWLYHSALKNFQLGNFAEVSTNIENLAKRAQRAGYVNVPSYSDKLLQYAQLVHRPETREATPFLVRRAVEISPTDARVHFTASALYHVIGWDAAVDYFWTAVKLAPNHPSIIGVFGANTLLTVLVAATMALLLLLLIQLVYNMRALLVSSTKVFSPKFRGYAAPVYVLVALVVPIFGGLLVALALWSLLLSRRLPGCRGLATIAGVLILCWGLSIPVVQTIGAHSKAGVGRALENVWNESFAPRDEDRIYQALQGSPQDFRAFWTLSSVLLREGEYADAERIIDHLLTLPAFQQRSGGYGAAMINKGVIRFKQGRLEDAKKHFETAERSGDKSFELMHNLAALSLARLDTNAHREYYNKAKELDGARLETIEQLSQTSGEVMHGVLPAQLPASMRLTHFLQPAAYGDASYFTRSVERRNMLANSLVPGAGGPMTIVVIGVVLLLWGLRIQSSNRREFARSTSTMRMAAMRTPSRIWMLVPAGPMLASPRPIPGFFLLTALITLVMYALQEPAIFLQVVPETLPLRSATLALAGVLFLGSLVWTFLFRRGGAVKVA